MEAHHYCSVINEEVNQCVIFDGNDKNAKMMGVEYIISKRLFDTFCPMKRRNCGTAMSTRWEKRA